MIACGVKRLKPNIIQQNVRTSINTICLTNFSPELNKPTEEYIYIYILGFKLTICSAPALAASWCATNELVTAVEKSDIFSALLKTIHSVMHLKIQFSLIRIMTNHITRPDGGYSLRPILVLDVLMHRPTTGGNQTGPGPRQSCVVSQSQGNESIHNGH